MAAIALAVDVGGTKLAVGLVDDAGTVLERRQTPTAVADPHEALARLIDEVLAAAGLGAGQLAGVGVSCGGPMRWPEGVVAPLNTPPWRDGFPLRRRLAEKFPDLAVRLHNDAICVAAGEHWRGAGRGFDNLLGMVVSTGVGGGLILDGHVRDGPTGNAGHVGHVVVEPDGPPCGCGGFGCLEAVARGPRTVEWARARGFAGTDGFALVAAARKGNAVALAALERSGRAVGRALAGVAALLDLDAVVLGGGLANAGPLLFDPLRAELDAHARLDFTRRLQVLPAQFGGDAGLVGGAALILAGERYWSAD